MVPRAAGARGRAAAAIWARQSRARPQAAPPPRRAPPPAAAMRPRDPLSALDRDTISCIVAFLGQADAVSVMLTCKALHAAVRPALLDRALTIKHAAWRWAPEDAKHVDVRALPRRYGARVCVVPLSLPVAPMAALRTLRLHHPRLPARAPFWPAVFAACPALESVGVIGDYFLGNYASDVDHATDLVELGAPRLRHLDVEGGWMVVYPVEDSPDLAPIARASSRAFAHAPVASSTLKTYRAACRQAPLPVDAPLERLEIVEPNAMHPGRWDARQLVGRFGPTTRASVRELRLSAFWPSFDASALAGFSALEDVSISIGHTCYASRLSACLASLRHLPAGVRRLRLALDLWGMRAGDGDGVEWGTPLRHLGALESLRLDVTFCPTSAPRLVEAWMGAGPSVREVTLRFADVPWKTFEDELEQYRADQPDADSEDDEMIAHLRDSILSVAAVTDVSGVREWLEEHPAARVTVINAPTLLFPKHARLAVRRA